MDYNEAYENLQKAKNDFEKVKADNFRKVLEKLTDGAIGLWVNELVIFQQLRAGGARKWVMFPVMKMRHEDGLKSVGYKQSDDIPTYTELDINNSTKVMLVDNATIIAHIQARGADAKEKVENAYRKGWY